MKNSYDGDTEIAGTGNLVNLTYNIGDASIVSGQTLTPWGQGNVTLGGSEKNVTVTFSNLNSNTVTGGVSLDGDLTLKGTNAATALSIFNGATVNVNLNGKVSVETSGTGTAAIASGDSLQMLAAWRNGHAGCQYPQQCGSPDAGRGRLRFFRNAEPFRSQPLPECGYGAGRNAERLHRQGDGAAEAERDRNAERRFTGR